MCTFKFQNYQQQLQYTAVKSSRPAALQPAAATPPAESSWEQQKMVQPNTVWWVDGGHQLDNPIEMLTFFVLILRWEREQLRPHRNLWVQEISGLEGNHCDRSAATSSTRWSCSSLAGDAPEPRKTTGMPRNTRTHANTWTQEVCAAKKQPRFLVFIEL